MSDASTASISLAPPAATIRLAIIALIVAAFAIACSPIFVRLSEVGPTVTALYRTSLGLPILAGWYQIGRRRSGSDIRPHRDARREAADRRLLCFAGFCFAGDLMAWHWSIHFTAIANSTLLANLSPIAVTLGAWYFFGEKITRGFVMALVGAVTGSVVLASSGISLDGSVIGDVLALLTGLFYAGYFLALREVRHRMNTATVMIWSGATCSLFLLPLALLSGEPLVPHSLDGWMILFGLAMISQILGQSLVGWALAHLPASYSSVSLLLQPIISITLAWAILNEPLTMRQALGGLIILLSIIAARRSTRL